MIQNSNHVSCFHLHEERRENHSLTSHPVLYSLEGDVGEQRDGGEDGRDAAAGVGDVGQDHGVLRVCMGRKA